MTAPTAPLRVVVVEAALRENGGVRVVLEHVDRWVRSGDEVVLAVVQDVVDGTVARPDPSVTVRRLSAPGARARWAAVPALVRLVRLARRADVVVSGSEEGNGLLLGRLAATLARRPFVVFAQCDVDGSIADWVPGPLRGLTRRIHASADASVCVAASVRDGVVALGLPPQRAHVVPNGVDAAALRARARASPSRPVDARTVVGCGRLASAKGFDVLIRAHARLVADGVEQRLLILGEGPERTALECLCDELGVRGSVSLPGFVDDVPALVARAGVFVLASRFEGAPLVLLEAVALGTPAVATRCASAVEEILEHGTGRTVEVGAVGELAEAIAATLELPMGTAAATEPEAPVDADESARRFRAVLHAVARPGTRRARRGRPPGPGHART